MSGGVDEPEVAFKRGADAPERDLDAVWTPEAVASVERAEAELAAGGGVPHDEVKRRSREMLGR